MDVFGLRNQLITDYEDYVKSFIHIKDRRIDQTVDEALKRGLLWPDPLIQLNPTFAPGGSIDDLATEGVLHEQCRTAFRVGKDKGGAGLPLRLHRHQDDAIRTARSGRNYILTTGTGSGKSLAYIVPIVDAVLRAGPGKGVFAIIIYPMNALANSQEKELEKFLGKNGPVRFAKYTGQEKDEERTEIWKNPPDILLTNFMMMELMLTRPDEAKLIEAAQGLRFLVLDELHTYRGRQGADVAMLVRRVRDRLTADKLQCVGTSATLAGGDTLREQQEAVAAVATTIFGKPVLPGDVIGETLQRATEAIDTSQAAIIDALRKRIPQPPPSTHDRFTRDPLASWIEDTFGLVPWEGRLKRAKPRPIEGETGAARMLAALTDATPDACADAIKATLMAGYGLKNPKSQFPTFAFRLHQFLSRGDTVYASLEAEADRYRVFHWHIAFPELFGEGRANGFSVVLGNPPWERVKLAELEFFAARHEAIAMAGTAAERKRLIAQLEHTPAGKALWEDYCTALRHSEGESAVMRRGGAFPLCGRGDVNTYGVFAELMMRLVTGTGRSGFIVPTGIATDDGNKFYFQQLVDGKRLVSLYDFENRQGIFDCVHRSYKFALLTIAGPAAQIPEAWFVFFAQGVNDLGDEERRIRLSPDDIVRINPNTRTCPIFRTRRDAEITKNIYQRVPVLIREAKDAQAEVNPWGVKFTRMFDMSNDSHLFKTRINLESDGWTMQGNHFHKGQQIMLPLYEAKMFHHFDHRWASFDHEDSADLTDDDKNHPDRLAIPRYWVIESEIKQALKSVGAIIPSAMIGFRNIARTTDARTFISSIIPISGVGNSSPVIFPAGHPKKQLILYDILTSMVFDWVTRCSMGGVNLNFYIVYQLPVLHPEMFQKPTPWTTGITVVDWLHSYTLELCYTARDLAPFAQSVGYQGPPFRWDTQRRYAMRLELDAAFFHLYGLNRDDTAYILDTFPIVKRKDEAQYGEYRTKRLILEAYDAMADAIRTGRSFQTKLDPPPADPRCAHPASP